MDYSSIKVRCTFCDPILGMIPGDPNILSTYIASKAPDAETAEEEIARICAEEKEDVRTTCFPLSKDDLTPILYDYQIRGFFKEAAGILKKVPGSPMTTPSGQKAWRAHKKNIDNLVFVEPREVKLHVPSKADMTVNQRPLRSSTPQGEKNILAASEELPEGTWIEFQVNIFDPQLKDGIIECLEYGKFKGMGQWRNSGKGRFTYELL